MTHDADIPTILFGAFDRHNFGDLLFPHVAAALLKGKNPIFAGLAARDLRCHGGHQVRALAQLVAQFGNRPVNIVHAGGELLTCNAWQAAVMLLPPDQVQQTIACFKSHPQEGLEWARSMLGISALAPYTVARELFPGVRRMIYNAVGGVDLDKLDPLLQAEVFAKLKSADMVGVRDRQTHALLASAGISSRLMPDPAVMVAELFSATIRERSQQGEVAQVRQAFPQGYIAVQCSVDFDDAETLATIAAQLDRIAYPSGLGVAFFRAGAAPWHDNLDCYRRIAAGMRAPMKIFTSLHLWDICALIAGSHVFAGSSLHGRIVAMAFALPRVNLRHRGQAQQPGKQDAFAATWDVPGLPSAVEVYEIADAIEQALAADPAQLQHLAAELAAQHRRGFASICAGLQ